MRARHTVRRCSGERGAVNLALLMFGVVMTAAGVVLFAVMSMAAGSVQRHQSAADAAALAGAGAFEVHGATLLAAGFADLDDLPRILAGSGPCPGVVRAEASRYASLNDATLTACRMDRFGEVSVTVRGEVPVGRETHDAKASASWGLPLDRCRMDPSWEEPEPPEEDAGPPADDVDPPVDEADPPVDEGPTPLDPALTWMQCGPLKLHLAFDGTMYKVSPWGQVKDYVEPRLTD